MLVASYLCFPQVSPLLLTILATLIQTESPAFASTQRMIAPPPMFLLTTPPLLLKVLLQGLPSLHSRSFHSGPQSDLESYPFCSIHLNIL